MHLPLPSRGPQVRVMDGQRVLSQKEEGTQNGRTWDPWWNRTDRCRGVWGPRREGRGKGAGLGEGTQQSPEQRSRGQHRRHMRKSKA